VKRLGEMVARWAAFLLARTWRLEVSGEEHLQDLRAAGSPAIYAVWHGLLLPPLWHRRRRGITLLVSAHRDGAALATAARRWGYRVVHGSSTRGGSEGLRGVVRVLRDGGDAAFTPDGPRGPARVVKGGAVAAAQHGAAALVPVGAHASSAWRARSWDGFLVPRPFARVRIVYGRPFRVTSGDSGIAAGCAELEARLHRAELEARCAS
jgi:lysophospholipid acyltransferase (LPLAT)-like uncharacterized protein